MQTLILNPEDFKEPEYWIAMCDKLGVSSENVTLILEVEVVAGTLCF
ncbi:MAG: hypothetical protein ACFFCM_16485 [Promethearchaeota archaeon]